MKIITLVLSLLLIQCSIITNEKSKQFVQLLNAEYYTWNPGSENTPSSTDYSFFVIINSRDVKFDYAYINQKTLKLITPMHFTRKSNLDIGDTVVLRSSYLKTKDTLDKEVHFSNWHKEINVIKYSVQQDTFYLEIEKMNKIQIR